jgi:DNA-binding transcriptional ArsR family regulator
MRRDVFQAIADPTRRAIISLLVNNSLTLNGVAENFDISRPAISKHIKILQECGLIIIKQEGRERYCEVQPEPLQEVNLWTEQYKRFWNSKLNSLEKFLAKKNKSKTYQLRK